MPLPEDLSENITITVELLEKVQNPEVFSLFNVITDFFAYDERHMTIKKDTVFVGLMVVE